MGQQKPADDSRELPSTTDFGIFYPIGYLVVAFPKQEDAQRVQQDLMTGGYEEADCELYTCKEVIAKAESNLEESRGGFLSRLSWSDKAIRIHLDAAEDGATFLLIYAPGDTDSERAMNVIRRGPFEFAHLYRRFTIEELQ
ncbi:hypothetical protein [Nitrosococcus watsonii]|uniref:Uncharacterized protein n=1 Tax=Nitrosococcus watsoni (strain C-113) TaxID=105559 RepID=D8K7N2_NITWC|nr:hypothetical protein [Nitrosococcus watsonii]ADJ28909.1 hypothetical protein Nwat_2076 [Nitrosococcus watsonii C-113]